MNNLFTDIVIKISNVSVIIRYYPNVSVIIDFTILLDEVNNNEHFKEDIINKYNELWLY